MRYDAVIENDRSVFTIPRDLFLTGKWRWLLIRLQ